MENEWIVIEIAVPGNCVELVSAVLGDCGCQGVVVEDRELDTFIVPDEELDPEMTYQIKAYFADCRDPQEMSSVIQREFAKVPVLQGLSLPLGEAAVVHMEDWAENWKQNFSTMRVGPNLIVRPSWEEYLPQEGEAVIEIDPGMAFGTGTHGTTLLCLQVIAEIFTGNNPPIDLLDVGTGSGILAIGAAALGCQKILANDIDPVACDVARQNVLQNGFAEQIEISPQPLEELAGDFDLVVANILAEENIRLKEELFRHLRSGGQLILSGILQEKEQLVRDGFAELPLHHLATHVQDGWVCLLYRRQN